MLYSRMRMTKLAEYLDLEATIISLGDKEVKMLTVRSLQ